MENKKRYEVIAYPDSMMETDSIAEAIRYANANKWDIYDNKQKRIIYDGLRDELEENPLTSL